jgi:hypothetical protein
MRLAKLSAGLLGFVILFNPYLVPGADSAPRLTDLIGAGLWVLLVVWLLTGRAVNTQVLGRLAMVFVLVSLWILRDVMRFGIMPSVGQIRWILAISQGYFLWYLARNPETRYPLVLGLVWGAVGNLGVVLVQWFGYTDLTVSLGLASARFEQRWAKVGGVIEVRPFGMWGHPNGSAGIITLGFPLILGLIDEGRLKIHWLLGGLLISFAASALTLTRSGMIVTALIFPVWALGAQQTMRQRTIRFGAILMLGMIAAIIGPPGGWERWTDKGTAANKGERLEATVVALDLALSNPLGLGADYSALLTRVTGGIPATHNAWMFLALVAGLPLTLFMMVSVVKHFATLLTRRSVEGWLAFGMIGLFFFEEYFRAVVFQILGLWMVATPAGLLASLMGNRSEPVRSQDPVPLSQIQPTT